MGTRCTTASGCRRWWRQCTVRLASLMTLDCTTKHRMMCDRCTSTPPHRVVWRVHRTCEEQLPACPAACRSEQIAIETESTEDARISSLPGIDSDDSGVHSGLCSKSTHSLLPAPLKCRIGRFIRVYSRVVVPHYGPQEQEKGATCQKKASRRPYCSGCLNTRRWRYIATDHQPQ